MDELLTKVDPVDWSKWTKAGSDDKVSPPSNKTYKLRAIDAVKAAARVAGTAFCNYADNTTIYDGKCYVDIDRKAMPQFLKYAAYLADVPADIARDEPFLDKLVKQFYLDAGENIVESPPESYINLNNGTLIFNQNGRSFEPHSPHRFIRYALDFDFEPDAKCPRWQEHLDRCLPDKEQQRYLAKLLALPFYQRKVETIIVLYGQAMTGKSVTLDVYRALLGRQNVVSETLAALTRSGENYRVANLDNKLACINTDINDKVGDDAVCKILASREPYSVRRAYGQPFEMRNYARIVCGANTVPNAFLKSQAMLRRLSLLEFKVTIKESEKRLTYADDIIKNERSGVLNWILDGLEELVRAGDSCNPLIPPESVTEDLQRIRIEGDSLTGWIDAMQHGEREGLGFVSRGGTVYFPKYVELPKLLADYSDWCGGKDVLEAGGFAIKLRGHGFTVLKRETGKKWGKVVLGYPPLVVDAELKAFTDRNAPARTALQ